MTLDELAAGLEVTVEQRDRGVAVADDTGTPLVERLEPFADALPCTPSAAATLVDEYATGTSVGAASRAAGIAPITGAKALHRVGEAVSPLGPTGRDVVRDWLDARLSRADALALADCDEAEFALAVFVETHEPIDAARETLSGALTVDRDDPLVDARGDADEFL